MRGVTLYIMRQIAWPLVFATLTLTGVIWLTQALRFIDRIVNNNLAFLDFLYLTMLVLPSITAIILPIAAFCATLYAFHRMAGDSEVVVLSSTGFSRLALARPALYISIAIIAIMYAITLYLMPLGSRTLRATQYEFRNDLAGMALLEGVFNTPTDKLTVYIRERDVNGDMLGVLVHDVRDGTQPITMMAEKATLLRTPQGPRLYMVNGNRQQIDPERKSLSLLYFDNYSLDLNSYSKQEGQGWREPSERYLHELFRPNMQDADDVNNYNKLIVEGHRRLVSPLYAPALILIAIAGVIGGEFNRRGQGQRLIAAGAVAIALQILSLGVSHLATKSIILIPLLYITPVAFMAAAVFMLREPGMRPRLREA
ncbi:MAG: LPS export ABC transporter permease LptF [Ferrovibrio sp.]|uniref:LPS export ABC transporter permease LptF n=1 Tax=Ferrovibrio sp. TaxID=1917215 RepID=UPI00391D24CA